MRDHGHLPARELERQLARKSHCHQFCQQAEECQLRVLSNTMRGVKYETISEIDRYSRLSHSTPS